MISVDAMYYMMEKGLPVYVDGYYKGKEVRDCGKLVSYGLQDPLGYYTYILDMDVVLQLKTGGRLSFSSHMYNYVGQRSVSFIYTCSDAYADQLLGRPLLIYSEPILKWEK